MEDSPAFGASSAQYPLDDDSLVSTIVSAHLKQRTSYISSTSLGGGGGGRQSMCPSPRRGSHGEEKAAPIAPEQQVEEPEEGVHMLLFSPATTREIKKARARVQAEEALEKSKRAAAAAAEAAAAAAAAISSSSVAAGASASSSSSSSSSATARVSFSSSLNLSSSSSSADLLPPPPPLGGSSFGSSFPADTSLCYDNDSDDASAGVQSSTSSNLRSLDSATKAVTDRSSALTKRLQEAAVSRKIFLSRRRNSMKARGVRALQNLVLPEEGGEQYELDGSMAMGGGDEQPWKAGSKKSRTSSSRRESFIALETTKKGRNSHNPMYIPFKARPLPVSNSEFGAGGQIGVPKVDKRPVTMPNSPMLGMTRKSPRVSMRDSSASMSTITTCSTFAMPPPPPSASSPRPRVVAKRPPSAPEAASAFRPRAASVGRATKAPPAVTKRPANFLADAMPRAASVEPVAKRAKLPKEQDPYVPFKALALPKSIGEGASGVPKVPKREITVPISPKLGVISGPVVPYTKPLRPRTSAIGLASQPQEQHHQEQQHYVKPQALKAKPFERLASGSAASASQLAQQSAKQAAEEEALKRAAAQFRARPLPSTTAEPQILRAQKRGLATRDENAEDSAPVLKSTIRAMHRQEFEVKREKSAVARQAKMEMTRIQLEQTEKAQLELLRQELKVLPR